MSFCIYRSIPLAKDTTAAWKAAEFRLLARTRTPESLRQHWRGNGEGNNPLRGCRILLNLGHTSGIFAVNSAFQDIIVNPSEVTNILRDPAATRYSPLFTLLPPFPRAGDPAWLKKKGYGGEGKEFVESWDNNDWDDTQYDAQLHVEGDHYRVVTVGTWVVQVSKRVDDLSSPSYREYEWIGIKESPNAVKAIAREAANRLPSLRTMIGWDIICKGNRAYVIEGNTCPGVNQATAERIYGMFAKIVEYDNEIGWLSDYYERGNGDYDWLNDEITVILEDIRSESEVGVTNNQWTGLTTITDTPVSRFQSLGNLLNQEYPEGPEPESYDPEDEDIPGGSYAGFDASNWRGVRIATEDEFSQSIESTALRDAWNAWANYEWGNTSDTTRGNITLTGSGNST